MSEKNKLEKLRDVITKGVTEFFSAEPAQVAKPEYKGKQKIKQGFSEAMLPDGSILMWESEGMAPMQNEPVMVLLPDGTMAPAPDNTYVLEDETAVTVAGGVAVSVTPKASAETPEATAPAPGAGGGMTEAQAKAIIESTVKETRFEIEKAFSDKLETVKADFAAQIEAIKKDSEEKVKQANDKAETSEKNLANLKQGFEKFSGQILAALSDTEGQPEEKPETPVNPDNAVPDFDKLKADFRKTMYGGRRKVG